MRLIFEQFDRRGTVYGVLRYLVANQCSPGATHQGEQRGLLQWRRPNRLTLQAHSGTPSTPGSTGGATAPPTRAGKCPEQPRSGRVTRPLSECLVLLPGRCPAYISEDRFRSNQSA